MRVGIGIGLNSAANRQRTTAPPAVPGVLAADRQSLSILGQPANLLRSSLMVSAAAGFTYTGLAASPLVTRQLVAAGRAFTSSVTSATLTKGIPAGFSANGRSLTLSGNDVLLKKGYRVAGATRAFTLSGTSAGLLRGQKVTAAATSFSLSGQAAGLRRAMSFGGGVGAFQQTGLAATLQAYRVLGAAAGSASVTGQAADFVVTPADSSVTTVWVAPTEQGAGDGTTAANAYAFSSFNTATAAAGPGGEVLLRTDLGEYSVTSATITNGGTSGNPILIRGDDGSGNPARAILKRDATNLTTVTASTASSKIIFNLDDGADYLNFQWMTLKDCGYGFRIIGQITGLELGDPSYRDTTIEGMESTFRSTYNIYQRASSGAVTDAAAITTASATSLSSGDLTAQAAAAVNFENVYRGIDVGTSSGTTDYVQNLGIYGGSYTGTSRGFVRLRGESTDFWVQDVTGDALAILDPESSFCIGFETNGGSSTNSTKDGVFLRVTSNNNWGNAHATYTNGDGFSGERVNTRISYIACTGNNNMDGGIETKATDLLIIAPSLSGNRRNMRLWGQADAYDVNLTNPDMTGRTGGNRVQVYSEGSSGMIRVHSGVISDDNAATTVAYANGAAGTYIAISSAVSVTKNAAATLYNAETGNHAFTFDPDDAVAPTFTSSGTRSTDEGSSDLYTPTTDKPCIFLLNGGADQAFVTRSRKTFSLQAQFLDDTQDADADDVYEYQPIAYYATGLSATQDVAVTIDAAIASTNILTRMAAVEALPSGRAAIEQDLIDEMIADGVLIRTEFLHVTKQYDEGVARLDWAGTTHVLTPDGTRIFPSFEVDTGYYGPSTDWAYINGEQNLYTKPSQYNVAMGAYLETADSCDVLGSDNMAITCSSGSAIIRPNSTTTITVPGAFPGWVYWDRKGDTVRVYLNGVLYDTYTSTAASWPSSGRMRFNARDGGNTSNPANRIMTTWCGVPLPDASIPLFYAALDARHTAVDTASDTVPDAFSFTDLTSQTVSTLVESNEITVAGIDAAAAISITGGEYSVNSGSYTSSAGTVVNGDGVKVRHTTSGSAGTETDTVLTIGGVSDTFTSTTSGAASAVTVFSSGFEGAGGSTAAFLDDTGNHTITPNSGADLNTSTVLEGSSSLRLDGSGHNANVTNGPDFLFGSDQFVLAFRQRPTQLPASGVVTAASVWGSTNAEKSWALVVQPDGYIRIDYRLTGDTTTYSVLATSLPVAVNTSYTIAFDRGSDGHIRLYRSTTNNLFTPLEMIGKSAAPVGELNAGTASLFKIGHQTGVTGGNAFRGRYDRFRIVKGGTPWGADTGTFADTDIT